MMNVFRDIWWIEFLHICFTILPGTAQFPPDSYIRHKYACDSQSSCRTNMYSVECSLGDKIAMKNVFYGAKTYTTYCPGPDTQLCVSKKQCCKYHKDDCLIPYHQKELWDIFMECSHGQQCGWLYAKSIELKDKCQIRKKSNYIRADYQCISGPLKRERKLYLEDETVPVPRSTKYFKQSKARKVMDPKGDCCNLKPAPQPPANLLQHELHDTTSICESTSNEEDTAEVEAVPVVHCSALQLPMKSENCYSDVKTLAKNSDFSNDKMGKYEQSDEEHNETNSVASCDSSSESDTDDESKCSSIMTSTESNDSEDENEIKSSRKPTELPAKDYQALSLMSCFLRNKFSKSACEDVIDTYKKLFSSEDVSSLNYHDIMSRIDFSPVNDFHYCSYCNAIFPEDRNIFNCPTPNCNGLRYKGPLAYQTDKARQPTQSFVFADVKTQLHTLLETTDSAFIDVCSQYTISAKSVHLHHTSIFRGIYNYNQCSCLITPDDCNSTASLKFRSFDIRLQSKGNFSHCNPESRIELIGQSELKQYYCEPQKFLYGFEDFHTSSENNMVFYLYKEPLQYPTKLWLEVQATLPGVGVRVTCGHRALHTAKRCPALPITGDRIVDVVDELPTKNPNKPIIISITPDGNGENGTDKDGPGEKPNTALAALIGGIVAGVVVLTLFLIVICIMLRKKRKKKEKADHVSYKIYLPTENQPQMNYYETVNDPDTHSVTVSSSTAGANIYHQPWEQRQGISLPNRANNGDLAYATSEEIKVLIEHMERDRKFINEGGEDDFPVPDKVYYRHISDYRYEPDDDSEDEDDDEDPLDGKNDSETESKSVNSEHSGTEKVESEDSKVEADRALDSDNESQKADSETVSGTFDGYESPRVSSFHPSDASSTHRSSSNRYSDYRSEFQRLVSQSSSKIAEDSDNDVPLEYAPPVSVAVNQSKLNTYMPGQSDDAKCNEVSLGSYGEPRISTDSGQGVDSESDASGHYYSSVYDKVKEQESQTRL